jgi:Transposase DDE domain
MEHHSADLQVEKEANFDQSQAVALLETYCESLVPIAKAPGRPPDISWAHFCLGIIQCFLGTWRYQRTLWRLLGWSHVGPFAPVPQTDQAIYNRLAHADDFMRRLFEDVTRWLHTYLEDWQERDLAPFAHTVLALDESTLDPLSRWLPNLRHMAGGDPKLLAGRLCGLFDLRFQQWVRVELFPNAVANCKVAAVSMLEGLTTGTLLLFDRGYFSFLWLDELTKRGIWWVMRYSNHVTYQIRFICYQGDGILDAIVYLGTFRADKARYPVRLIAFWYRGQYRRYLTNVLNPQVLSVAQVVELYARRWDIEIAFRMLKDYLGLNELWSAKWPIVCLQIWTGLLLAQLFHALQRQVAVRAGVDPQDVSLDVLVRLTPDVLPQGGDMIERLARSGREMGLIRPSTRKKMEVPWIDPSWVYPPPPEAITPREDARYRHHHDKPNRRRFRSQARSPN